LLLVSRVVLRQLHISLARQKGTIFLSLASHPFYLPKRSKARKRNGVDIHKAF
jgi:hypothetical protein